MTNVPGGEDGMDGGRSAPMAATDAAVPPRPDGVLLARGVCRALVQLGQAPLTEVTLKGGRRADVLSLDSAGRIAIVEVKSSLADFRADGKWGDYLAFCDRFYFAVPPDFPLDILPDDCGLMVADAYAAAVLREAPDNRLAPARRKAVTLRFAQLAARRLIRAGDPEAGV